MLIVVRGARFARVDHELDNRVFADTGQTGHGANGRPSQSKLRMRARSSFVSRFIMIIMHERCCICKHW